MSPLFFNPLALLPLHNSTAPQRRAPGFFLLFFPTNGERHHHPSLPSPRHRGTDLPPNRQSPPPPPPFVLRGEPLRMGFSHCVPDDMAVDSFKQQLFALYCHRLEGVVLNRVSVAGGEELTQLGLGCRWRADPLSAE